MRLRRDPEAASARSEQERVEEKRSKIDPKKKKERIGVKLLLWEITRVSAGCKRSCTMAQPWPQALPWDGEA